MVKYLVTGGAGFIGSHIVDTLVTQGANVVVLDNFSNGSWDNLEDAINKHPSSRFKVIEGDICDFETCRTACRGVEYVLHEAALGSISRSVEYPIQTHNTNANGTLNMLIAARDAGVKRFVYASSSSIYGASKVMPRIELDSPKPISPYAVSKITGEHYSHAFCNTYGLETVVLRYFNVFGPRQNVVSQYAAVIPRFINAIINKKQPIIYGDGEQYRDFTYVENVVKANLLALSASSDVCGRSFNIACGGRYTVNELYRILKESINSNIEAKYEEARSGDIKGSVADITNAVTMLNYKPSVSFEDGIVKTVNYFKQKLSSS